MNLGTFFRCISHLKPSTLPLLSSFSKYRTCYSSVSKNQGKGSYEGDGKTTVTILNQEDLSYFMIDAYHTNGFKLNNGMLVIGPIAIFPKTVLGWDVGVCTDITPASLQLFSIMEPKVDLLLIGLEEKNAALPKESMRFLKSNKINFEVAPTESICSTFNFMNSEKRFVAGVMIPPKKLSVSPDEAVNFRIRKDQLYSND